MIVSYRGEAKGNAEEAWIRTLRRIFLGSKRHSSVFSPLLADLALRIGSAESEQQQLIRLTPSRSPSKLTLLRFLKSETLLLWCGGWWKPSRLSLKSNWVAKPLEPAAIYRDGNAIGEKPNWKLKRDVIIPEKKSTRVIRGRDVSFAFVLLATPYNYLFIRSENNWILGNKIRMGQWERGSGFRGWIYVLGHLTIEEEVGLWADSWECVYLNEDSDSEREAVVWDEIGGLESGI